MNPVVDGRARSRPLPSTSPNPTGITQILFRHRRDIAAFCIWLLVLASVVSWRRGVLYSGGLDSTVVLKAVIAVVALAAAFLFWRTSAVRRPLSLLPAVIVGLIVVISVVGAFTLGAVVPNAVLAVRIVILGATALLVLAGASTETAVATLLAAMAAVGLFAAVTGIGSIRHTGTQAGRLGGGIPALEPNELASLLLPPAIGLLALLMRRGLRLWPVLGVVVLAVLIGFTGSRTALAMLLIGALVALFVSGRVKRVVVIGVVVGLAALVALLSVTPLLSALVLRGEGISRLLSLNSRTIAWNAVLALPKDEASWWLGHGLSMKSIHVTHQYWATQVFDSSWFSSLAQDGVLGTVLLAVFAIGTLVLVVRSRPARPWALPLVVTLLIRSVVENGLIDSSATFVLFFIIATAVWPGRRAQRSADSARGMEPIDSVPSTAQAVSAR